MSTPLKESTPKETHPLIVQARVIYALVLREMLTRFGDRKLGYAWVLIEVVMHVSVFLVIRHFMNIQIVRDMPPSLFLISGIVPFFYFRSLVTRIIRAIESNKGILIFNAVTFLDLCLARYVLETITYSVVMVVMCTFVHFYMEPLNIGNFLGAAGIFYLFGFLGLGCGLCLISLVTFVPSIASFIRFVLRILYFTSGILFSVTLISEQYYPYLQWNPIITMAELFRENFYQGFRPVEEFSNLTYVLIVSVALFICGDLLIRRSTKHILR